MTTTTTYSRTLVVIDCCTCGVSFGMTTEMERARRRDHAWFYCPNGHNQHFTAKSDADLLAEERRRAKRLSDLLDDEQQQHRATERSLRATRGVVTRTKKRIAAGVCPCCNRTFQRLARHMAGQHPDYATEGEQ
jgi:hypothetical protein